MSSIIPVLISFAGYILAYKFYGKFISKKIFRLNNNNISPSVEFNDRTDFVPTRKEILFGHHFTSIAGLGPIVGPAIAIIWGWLPALLWIVFGSIFMGAVHDIGVLVISMRNKGGSLGDIAAIIISPRIRNIILIVMFLANLMVIAVFTLIVAILFDMYPSAVIPIWAEIPIAIFLGYLIYQKKVDPGIWSIIAVLLMYGFVIIGAYVPLRMPEIFGINPLVIWAIISLIYSYVASTLPVTTLLQPRDYINGHQLFVALGLMFIGVLVANPIMVAPVLNTSPDGAPSIVPFLFIIVACGAISGFHSLVSGGTTSKQCHKETDAQAIGYGGMLMEGVLSVLVVIAVGAGIGLGLHGADGNLMFGAEAFTSHYSSWVTASGLGAQLKAFVEGSANLMESYGIPVNVSITVMGVFIVSFASTTLDSATRIQRYIVSEFAKSKKINSLTKPHPATLVATGITALICFHDGFTETALRSGALALWPLFGVMNQMLAALALFIITVYLFKKEISIIYTVIPAVFMSVITIWAAVVNIENFMRSDNRLLLLISIIAVVIQIWIIFEALRILKTKRQSVGNSR